MPAVTVMLNPFTISARTCLLTSMSFALGCGGPSVPSNGDSGPATLQACATSGAGAVITAGPCSNFSPTSAGASALGQNASRMNYALEPTGAARNTLVVLLNGS